MVKGWYAKHKDTGKWHKIKDVKDTGISADREGGGNNYHLEDIGPVHQSKIADMRDKPPMDKSDSGDNMEKKYHIFKDGQQVTATGEEMTMKEVESKHGVKKLNNSGHILKPAMNKAIPGGLADGKKTSDFDPKKLAQGVKVEMEHTSNKSIAQEIAMDHLTEDINYYDKLKTIEKYDRIEEECDGKKELDYGKEDLDKAIRERWARLKKALNSDDAIMTMESQEYQDEEDDDEQSDEPVSGSDNSAQPQEEGEEDAQPVEQEEGQTDLDDQDSTPPEEQGSDDSDAQASDGEEEGGDDLEELTQHLRDGGYSESEIAYVVHNHMMPEATVDDIKTEGQKAKNSQDQDASGHDLEHKKRMNELEFQQAQKDIEANSDGTHKQRMNDLEYDTAAKEQGTNDLDREHKKRMLDLEYETAQKEKEMELQFKQQEFALKLEGQKAKDAHSLQTKKDSAKSRQQDASKTSSKEKKGK